MQVKMSAQRGRAAKMLRDDGDILLLQAYAAVFSGCLERKIGVFPLQRQAQIFSLLSSCLLSKKCFEAITTVLSFPCYSLLCFMCFVVDRRVLRRLANCNDRQ